MSAYPQGGIENHLNMTQLQDSAGSGRRLTDDFRSIRNKFQGSKKPFRSIWTIFRSEIWDRPPSGHFRPNLEVESYWGDFQFLLRIRTHLNCPFSSFTFLVLCLRIRVFRRAKCTTRYLKYSFWLALYDAKKFKSRVSALAHHGNSFSPPVT